MLHLLGILFALFCFKNPLLFHHYRVFCLVENMYNRGKIFRRAKMLYKDIHNWFTQSEKIFKKLHNMEIKVLSMHSIIEQLKLMYFSHCLFKSVRCCDTDTVFAFNLFPYTAIVLFLIN